MISASRSKRLSGVARALALDHPDDEAADLRFRILAAHPRQAIQIEPVQQLLVDPPLQLLVVAAAGVHADRRIIRLVCNDDIVSNPLCSLLGREPAEKTSGAVAFALFVAS